MATVPGKNPCCSAQKGSRIKMLTLAYLCAETHQSYFDEYRHADLFPSGFPGHIPPNSDLIL